KTPNDLLKFIHTFGPLGRGGFAAGVSGPEPVRGGATWGDDVSSGLRQAKFFRDLLLNERNRSRLAAVFNSEMRVSALRSYKKAYERTGERVPAIEIDDSWLSRMIADIDLVADSKKGLRFRIQTETLISAMWWQLGQKLSGNVIIRECRHCGILFKVGPGSGRRRDATFCCNEHSVRFYSLKRSTGDESVKM